jgi:hypothetical protein
MGKITRGNKSIIVHFDKGEIALEKAYISLPPGPPPQERLVWTNSVGNILVRAAWVRLYEKAPQLLETINPSTVKAEISEITITFYKE